MSNIKNKIINKARIYLLFLWSGVLIYFIFYSPFNIIELNIHSLNFEAIFSIFLSFLAFLTFSAICLEIFFIYKLKFLIALVLLFFISLILSYSMNFMTFIINLAYLPFLARLTNSFWNNTQDFQSFFCKDKGSQKNELCNGQLMYEIIFEGKYVANLLLDNLNNLNLAFPILEVNTYADLPILREIKISDFQNLLEEQKSRLEQEKNYVRFATNSKDILLNKSRFPVFSEDESPEYINKIASKLISKIVKSKNIDIFVSSKGLHYLYDKKTMMGVSYIVSPSEEVSYRGFFEYIFGEYNSELKILSSSEDALDYTFLEVYLKDKFFALIHEEYGNENITIEFPNAKHLNVQEEYRIRNISLEDFAVIINVAKIYFSRN